MRLRYLAAALLFMPALGISGDATTFIAGDELQHDCEKKADSCAGYIAGVVDTIATLSDWGVIAEKPFCLPNHATLYQLSRVMVKYFNEHPEELHLTASSLVLTTLPEAFPCPKSGGQPSQ